MFGTGVVDGEFNRLPAVFVFYVRDKTGVMSDGEVGAAAVLSDDNVPSVLAIELGIVGEVLLRRATFDAKFPPYGEPERSR